MFKRILTFSLSVAVLASSMTVWGQGESCIEMEPICTDDGISFTAGDDGEAEDGNDYGCLASWPSPSWYYLQISVDGDIEMELYADDDIDFIIWGPFDDLEEAIANCGTLGGSESPIVDCSYSATEYETPEITGTTVGEVYILLITNYSGEIQEVTCGKIGGEAETDCGIISPCEVEVGTFTIEKNGETVADGDPVYLCEGDEFEIVSNEDYVLPPDTIPSPVGDGIYTAQIIWLVYNAPPVGDDPVTDPGYMGLIIPAQDLMDVNDGDSPIIDALGCGTYYLVPVTADDGVGDGGDNDNNSVTWDKDANGCYELGDPVEIVYACAMEAEFTVNCGEEVVNGMDIEISGGSGDFTVVNAGAGELAEEAVESGGTATIFNLENGWGYEILVTDEEGCQATFEGLYAAPVIDPVDITPAVSCPDASEGNVDVTIVDGSGNGAPYTVVLNGTPTPGITADFSGIAGTAVTIIAVDAEGCITDSVVTIGSLGHFIDIDVLEVTHVTCFGDDDGAAEILANPENEDGEDDGEIESITWTDPVETNFPGDETNTSRTGMMPGTWFVTVLDDYGCEVTIPIEIESPDELNVFVNTLNEPTCYSYSDGSVDLSVVGGTGGYEFSWKDHPGENSDVLNTIGKGTYWGYVTDENGCVDSAEVVVGQPDSLYGTFIVKNVDCFGDSTGSIVVDEVFNFTGEVRYHWDLGGVIPNPPNHVSAANGLPAGTYLVTIQDEFCDNLYQFTVLENPEIIVELGHRSAYCRLFDYQNGGGVVYGSATGGVADYEYLWTLPGTTESSINSTWGALNPGEYHLRVTDELGCIKDTSVVVDSLSPKAIFTVTSDQLNSDLQGTETVFANFSNQSINFSDTSNILADTTFFWNFNFNPQNPSDNWIISNSLEDEFDTSYVGEAVYEVCLVALNHFGCKDTACKEITVYAQPEFVPVNIFTPDGDGKNDLFTFEGLAKGIDEFSCVVVDRWGQTVFEFTDINQSWDGNRRTGLPCTDGVYFYAYAIKYTNGTRQEGQGNVTVLRDE